MNANMVNMFESQDSNKFLESIAMSHLKIFPYILTGSKNCLLFSDSVTSRKITMCLEDPKMMSDIQKAFLTLFSCRNKGRLPKKDINIKEMIKTLSNIPKDHKRYEKIRKDLSREFEKNGV